MTLLTKLNLKSLTGMLKASRCCLAFGGRSVGGGWETCWQGGTDP